jgi:dTDP-4-dehydrorhamnose reductase
MLKPILKRVLVTGENGQVGQSLKAMAQNYPQFAFYFAGREQLDLASDDAIKLFFSAQVFDAIIHCAAYTAVDKAESEPALANQINHLAVAHIAKLAKEQNALLIYLSTDYVFDGCASQPYDEAAQTCPINLYGQTKRDGELAIIAANPNALIVRTSWVYAKYGHNFVNTMLKLGRQRDELNVVYDQIGTPTYAPDLAAAILVMLNAELVGSSLAGLKSEKRTDKNVSIFHYTNEGVCSWYDFAQAVFEMAAIPCRLKPIESLAYPTPAQRPCYSLLSKARIKQAYGLQIPHWRESLAKCLPCLLY